MDLQITGTVIDVLQEQSGEGKNGQWRKQEFILETGGQYPKQICLVQWGDNIDKFAVQKGETLTAHIDIQSREYQSRWYTDVKAWRVERPQEGGQGGSGQGGPAHMGSPDGPEPPEMRNSDVDDDLPF